MDIVFFFAGLLLMGSALWFGLGVLHEAGHALAALLLVPGPVTVYLGTYGRPTGNWHLRAGRLQVYLAHHVLWWRGGYCECAGMLEAAAWRQRIFILAGPLLPVALAAVGVAGSLLLAPMPLVALAIAVLLLAVYGAAANLWPRRRPVALADGSHAYNDGQQLRRQWHLRQLATKQHQAAAYNQTGQQAESMAIYQGLLLETPTEYGQLRNAIQYLLQAEQYHQALPLSTRYQREFVTQLTDGDRFTHALLLSRTDQHHLALEAYSALINQPQPYLLAYSNRGYTHHLLGNYELALADFNQVILHSAAPAYDYANRGLILLKLGQETAGLADIRHSLALDPANAYGCRNLGIYYFSRNEYAEALVYFEQAQQHDPATHQLTDYLQQTRQHLEEASDAGGLPQYVLKD